MFDPIPQRDYYSLHGIFASSMEPKELPIIGSPPDKAAAQAYWKQRTELQTKLESFGKGGKGKDNKNLAKEKLELQASLDALDVNHPGAPGRAMILEDKDKPGDSPIFLRGEAENKGDLVPRRYLEVINGAACRPFSYGSGRLELAYAIGNRNNPLTARVWINRLWLHHFGEGIVTTPDDFGTQSAPPSHPELLDWLATTYMDTGWSTKKCTSSSCSRTPISRAAPTIPVMPRPIPSTASSGAPTSGASNSSLCAIPSSQWAASSTAPSAAVP